MLKLLIADDERIIRETISRLIDWHTLGVELIGLCSNGLEAYDMILDESPDIVLTDIKMPGMNGLELIKNISETKLNTQFIILSGYGEFEYAKEAMKYGVKHYILKPCNEKQISESILAVINDCHEKRREQMMKNGQPVLTSSMHYNIISNLITECAANSRPPEEIMRNYDAYMDFSSVSYRLFYVYFLEYNSLEAYLKQLQDYYDTHMPQIALHGVYIRNTLLLFFQNYAEDYQDFKDFLTSADIPDNPVSVTIEEENYPHLGMLMDILTEKLKRFSTIYTVNHFHPVCTNNHASFSKEVLQSFRNILSGTETDSDSLQALLSGIEDISFLKQTANSLLLEGCLQNGDTSPAQLTEWLLRVNQAVSPEQIRELLSQALQQITDSVRKQPSGLLAEQIYAYVEQHLEDSNITLKEIAENHLFMNVDYVSRKFLKETGRKFSDYLAEVRIRNAKQYLAEGYKVQDVAEKVGCGNNPHYFSQLFKKKTGMSPSAYGAKDFTQ